MHARMTTIQFPPSLRSEVAGAARGLVPILEKQRGFAGLDVILSPEAGEGVVIAFWETVEDAEAGKDAPAYIGQMSLLSSFLYGRLIPKTYEVAVRT